MSRLIFLLPVLIFEFAAVNQAFSADCVNGIEKSDNPTKELISCLKILESENQDLLEKVDKIEKRPLPIPVNRIQEIANSAAAGTKLNFRAYTQDFSNFPSPSTVPSSIGAVYCGLAFVDDDHINAWCKVFWDGSEWKMQTGMGPDFNACAVTCLYAEAAQ